ncbi:hypothetical protein AgCh_038340 [Apium graveolens]
MSGKGKEETQNLDLKPQPPATSQISSNMRELEKMIDKDRMDYSSEDISSIMKDAKVRHILYNSLDSVMSNRVIGCKMAKEIWYALEVKCQGTSAIKKNRRTILTQEYEHFDSRDNESLTEIYDRFQKLLNDLSLVDKEYDLEDSNLKFLLALPEKWDYKVTSIRDNYELDKTPLDEIYGVLKTHELEWSKGARGKDQKLDQLHSCTQNTDSNHNNNEDMNQMVALLVKSFKKMVYKNFRKGRRFSRNGSSSSNYDKRNNRRDTDWKEARSEKPDKSEESVTTLMDLDTLQLTAGSPELRTNKL